MGFSRNHGRNMYEKDPMRAWGAGRASVVGIWVTLLLACTPLDRPARLPEPLPEDLLAYLEADSISARFLHDGLSYHFVWSEKGPILDDNQLGFMFSFSLSRKTKIMWEISRNYRITC